MSTERGAFLRHPKLTSRQRQEIVRRYLDGETAASLALEFGVGADGLRQWLPPRNPRRPPDVS